MSLAIEADTVPLKENPDGVVLVGGTRVTLDTIVAAFREGSTPEEIAQQYPTLELADVYTVISYYLRRLTEVDAYLRQRQDRSDSVRRDNESRCDPQGVRDRLLSRRHGGA